MLNHASWACSDIVSLSIVLVGLAHNVAREEHDGESHGQQRRESWLAGGRGRTPVTRDGGRTSTGEQGDDARE